MDTERLMNWVKVVARFIFVTVNNFYCIPVHLIWLLFLYPLTWIAENLYWTIEGTMFRWLLSMVALWSYSAGYHIRELGDDISDVIHERTVILFNHQSTADVPLIMSVFNTHHDLMENVLWIMNSVFKKTNFGIVSWVHGDFFITSGKEHRESSLNELAEHLVNFYIPRERKWIVLFPEGGFLKNRKESSQRFAVNNNLPHLENVSLPRVGALKVIMDTVVSPLKIDSPDRVKYLVDVTVAYPKGDPLDLQTIVGGWRSPCDTIFHYRIYKIEELPIEEEALMKWLYERYYEKEKILQDYYDSGKFPDVHTNHVYKVGQENGARKPVARLLGQPIYHDPLDFLFRHSFYFASTWLWYRIFQGLVSVIYS